MIVKKILLSIFHRKSLLIKVLSIIKNIIVNFSLINKINKKYSIFFLPKLIISQIELENNFLQNNEYKTYFNKKYKFDYDDWFSHNIPIWKKYIKELIEIDYLEIGSFEGRSTVFIGELENVKSITAIDTFKGGDEHNDINFDKVLNNFQINVKLIKNKNVKTVIDNSENFFKNNNKIFNLIYIDGSHRYEDVKKDFSSSYKILKKDGIIILDDFLWRYYTDIKKNPMKAIIENYETLKKNLEILYINNQVIFKKIEN